MWFSNGRLRRVIAAGIGLAMIFFVPYAEAQTTRGARPPTAPLPPLPAGGAADQGSFSQALSDAIGNGGIVVAGLAAGVLIWVGVLAASFNGSKGTPSVSSSTSTTP